MQLFHGDCLEEMEKLPANSIDIVIADLPYGRFKHNEWDSPIDLERMWEQVWRVCKPSAPVLLFGDFRFAHELLNSQPKLFRYEIVWDKEKSTTPLLSQRRFGKCTEYILVFYKNPPLYNYKKYHKIIKTTREYFNCSYIGGKKIKKRANYYEPPLPLNTFRCPPPRMKKLISSIPEKPQPLLEHLLKYFSNEGDTCLDFVMGSGSCGVACQTLKRKFIGIELKREHYVVAEKRLTPRCRTRP